MDVQRLVEIDFIYLLIPACFINNSVCFIIPVWNQFANSFEEKSFRQKKRIVDKILSICAMCQKYVKSKKNIVKNDVHEI